MINYSARGGSGSSLSVPSTSAYVVSLSIFRMKKKHQPNYVVLLVTLWRIDIHFVCVII